MKISVKALGILLLVLRAALCFAADAPTVTIATESDPCEGSPVTVTATPAGAGVMPAYQWTVNDIIQPETGPVLLIKNGVGRQEVRCKVSNTITGESGLSNLLIVDYLLNVTAFTEIYYLNDDRISNDLQICSGKEVIVGTMYNSRQYEKLLNINFSWQINGLDIGAPNKGVLYISTLVPGDVITCKISYSGKCIVKETATSNALQPTIIPAVNPTVTIAPDPPGPCIGPSYNYTATALNAGPNPSYQWLLNNVMSGSDAPQFNTTGLQAGDHLICKVTGVTPCGKGEGLSNEIILINAIPELTNSVTIASSVKNNIITAGQAVSFTATVASSTNISYNWQVNGVDIGNNTAVFSSTNLNNGDVITCNVNTPGLCVVNPLTTSNAITVLMKTAINIPNTFTPNGDGVNDTWNITSLLAYPGCTINIFNRYGGQVYNAVNYVKGWDGTNNGKDLPAGTYYYIIDPNDGSNKLSGWVTILR
ncbi:hypothetical protein A0256_24165 [Mucilaginibacter sp. PAMC 26640]|nr:hypothetical protein A0256_24165 [Mucilaginibacter sp. PAMC 26640]